MNPIGIVGAIVGGVIGAVIWAAIAYFANLQLGFVAWAIGFFVGSLSAKLGGRGAVNGGLCAVIAMASILLGKGMAVHFALEKELTEIGESVYADWKTSAEAFQQIKDDEAAYPEFVFEQGFSEGESVEEVTDEELRQFKEESIPTLTELAAGQTYDQWAEKEFNVETSEFLVRGVKESLGILDIVFALLGIVTAFKIGSGWGVEE